MLDRGGWIPIAPSAMPFSPAHSVPKAVTAEDIELIRRQFGEGTERALKAGFDVVEIHMAHGYLLHEFLSPLANRRADEYGGSLENRMRFPLAIARTVREIWPKKFCRSSCEFQRQTGWREAGI